MGFSDLSHKSLQFPWACYWPRLWDGVTQSPWRLSWSGLSLGVSPWCSFCPFYSEYPSACRREGTKEDLGGDVLIFSLSRHLAKGKGRVVLSHVRWHSKSVMKNSTTCPLILILISGPLTWTLFFGQVSPLAAPRACQDLLATVIPKLVSHFEMPILPANPSNPTVAFLGTSPAPLTFTICLKSHAGFCTLFILL